MRQIYLIVVSAIASCLIGGCGTFRNDAHGMDRFDDALTLAKQVYTTGNGMLSDPHTDYSGLTPKEIEQFRKTRLGVKLREGEVGEISIWDNAEYEAIVSQGQLSRWEWSIPPNKVILIKELDNDPDSFVGLIFGVIEKEGKWYFCRAYIPEG
jgi:hypothetical protein